MRKQSANHFFTILIRNNITQEVRSFVIKTASDLDRASALASQRAQAELGWSDLSVLEAAERLMGTTPPQIDS